jgi:hypothetical protein
MFTAPLGEGPFPHRRGAQLHRSAHPAGLVPIGQRPSGPISNRLARYDAVADRCGLHAAGTHKQMHYESHHRRQRRNRKRT